MNNKLIKSLLLIGLMAFVFQSCKEKEDQLPPEIKQLLVLISNEGNFGWGKGTLATYDPESKNLQKEVYEGINNLEMGNVFQSISKIGDRYYFVINNSGKILVTNESLEFITEITGFTSPRHIQEVGANKAYVSDLFANKLWVVDLDKAEISGEISLNGWTEQMFMRNGMLWVLNRGNGKVYEVDPSIDMLVDSVYAGLGANSMVLGTDDSLRVLCADWSTDTSLMSVLDLNQKMRTDTIHFAGSPSSLRASSTEGLYYFLDQDVYTLNVKNANSRALFYDMNFTSPYGFGVDPETGDLYISDAKDFASVSSVIRLSDDGTLLDEFQPGIITGSFYFGAD